MKIALLTLLTLLTMIYNIYEDSLLLTFKVFEPAASAQSMSALIVPAMETCAQKIIIFCDTGKSAVFGHVFPCEYLHTDKHNFL